MSNFSTGLPQAGRVTRSQSRTVANTAVRPMDSGEGRDSIAENREYYLRNRRVNRHCNTITSCRAQDLGRGSCSENEVQSPSACGSRSVTSSRATANLNPTIGEEHTTNASQPTFGVSRATEVNMPATTRAGKPRKRMKWTSDINSFIMRTYFKVTNMENDLTAYRYALHSAFVQQYPDLRHITEQRVADQRRAIINNNLLPAPTLQQIRSEVLLELQTENGILNDGSVVESTENGDHNGEDEQNPEIDRNPTIDNTNSLKYNADAEFHKALAEFDGTNPIRRPKLPKLKTCKTTNAYFTAFNSILQNAAMNCRTLEQLHAIVYCGAIAMLRCHNQQVQCPRGTYQQDFKNFKPAWQRRLESAINDTRQELGRLTEFRRNPKPSKRLKNKINKIFKKIGTHHRHQQHEHQICEYVDLLKQKLKAKSKRLSRYLKCTKRKQQNRLFSSSQKLFYRKLDKVETTNKQMVPNKDDLTNYWSSIWSNPKQHKQNAHWIETEQERVDIPSMQFEDITANEIAEIIKGTNNWKAPGVDNIQNFWYKKFNSLHPALAEKLSHILHNPEDTPAFLSLGMTYMLPKSTQTGDPSQYRPITCLPTLYKILTSCITNRIYRHIDENNVLAEEQKGCKRDHQGCKEQLIIDSVIIRQAMKEHRNIYTAFVDYRKAFDSVPHSWLLKVLQMYKIHPTIISFLEATMKNWRTNLQLNIGNKSICTDEIHIRRGIYQGDSLSPLWFCLAMNPLSTMLNSTGYGFKTKANRNTSTVISHLLYMDDIKLYAANQHQVRQLLDVTQTFSGDIHMEFGLNKCKTLNIEKGIVKDGDVVLPNGDLIQALQNGETYKYLGFQQARLLDHKQAKKRIRDQYTERVRSLLKTELNAGNLVQAINTYAVPVLTYSFGILSWSKTELEDIQRVTRTMMTKYNAHHPKSSTLRTIIPRKEGGRAVTDIVGLHTKQVTKLRDFFHRKTETSDLHRIIVGADKECTPLNLAAADICLKTQTVVERLDMWSQKALHGRHHHDLNQPHINKEASNRWLTDGSLFPETEGFMMAIQDQVINTNNYKKFIIRDPNTLSDKCRKCQQASETIQHVTSGCTNLANTDYLHRHNQVCNIIHQKLANKFGLINTFTPYYKYHPQKVLENGDFRLYFDRPIITDRQVTNNRPDIVIVDRKADSAFLVDVAVPNNNNVLSKYQEKMAKYTDLAIEIKQMWKLERVDIIPVIVSSTGLIPKTLEDSLTKLGLHTKTYIDIQKCVILNTCRSVRKFLNT